MLGFFFFFFFQAEDGIRDRSPSRGLGDVYKRQVFLEVYLWDAKALPYSLVPWLQRVLLRLQKNLKPKNAI